MLVFGEPGSGKTTALRKLHQLAFDPGAEALGLAPGTLPIFLRLRRFSPDRLAGSLADLIEAEIQEISGGRVPGGIGTELWQRGRLLLLFDGLDEIADETHRAKVLERVAWWLDERDAADMRAIVSTRSAGWTDEVQAVRLDGFRRADVRPFDDEQIRALVEPWFREVVRLGQLTDAAANERSSTLVRALHEERNQQIQVLVSTPMLLTLLCVVVMRGGEIPRRRVDESWDRDLLGDTLFVCQDVVVALLPGEPRPSAPVDSVEVFDLADPDDADFEKLVDRLHGDGVEPSLAVESLAIEAETPVVTASTPEEGELFDEPITGETFLWVPGGRFEMGSNTISEEEQPVHWVRLSPYWMARTPVTNRQFALFLAANPGTKEPDFWRDRRFSDPAQPVVGVSWHDAVAYCRWLSEASTAGVEFRLPSEAQWEFAARGEEGRVYPWGDEEPDASRGCFAQDREKGKPAAVGSYAAGAGPFEHLDLAGNVWEWCVDSWEPNYQRWANEEPTDPVGQADDSLRPLRGGSWLNPAGVLRSAFRGRLGPEYRGGVVGFRVVFAPELFRECRGIRVQQRPHLRCTESPPVWRGRGQAPPLRPRRFLVGNRCSPRPGVDSRARDSADILAAAVRVANYPGNLGRARPRP